MTDTDLPVASSGAVDPDPRAKQLLKLLVEHYIAEGTPVASKALATLPGVEVSSATVRNVMSDLESMGIGAFAAHVCGKNSNPAGTQIFCRYTSEC